MSTIETQQLIEEFLMLEALGDQLKQRAYRARVTLERLTAPAPAGVKENPLTKDQQAAFIAKFRKGIIKKTR